MLSTSVKCVSATSTMSLPKCYTARVDVIVSTIRYVNVSGTYMYDCVSIFVQKSYQPDLKVEPTKQMRHQMEKKKRKEQERRKSFKSDRQDKMSHVSMSCYSCMHYCVLFIVIRLLFG